MYIDIIEHTKRDVIERESTKIGLAVNEGKMKYMLSASRDLRRIDSLITADNYTFDTVKEFVYLGSPFAPKMMSVLRITAANRCYYGLNGHNKILQDAHPTRASSWRRGIASLLSADVAALRVFERKVLRKVFDPVRVGSDFSNRYNSELY